MYLYTNNCIMYKFVVVISYHLIKVSVIIIQWHVIGVAGMNILKNYVNG